MILDEDLTKVQYSIGEVAEIFQEEVHTIRFWETKFNILKPLKNNKGNRMFTTKDVKNLRTIHFLLRDKKMTIEGAILHLENNREGIEKNAVIINRLKSIKQQLQKVAEQLNSDTHED